jgi:competence protein ComEC
VKTTRIASTLLVLLSGIALAGRGYDKKLSVHFIDVGQGDCIFITTPNDTIPGNGMREGLRILIDAGDKGEATDTILSYLKELGLVAGDTIDWVVMTHSDADHVSGLPAVYHQFQVMNTIDPGFANTSKIYKSASDSAKKEPGTHYWKDPIKKGLIKALGDTLPFGRECSTRLLYYSPKPVPHSDDVNNTSVVLRLAFGKTSFLLTGDAELYAESIMVERYGDTLKSTVLKVGHHGSPTAWSDEFMDRVKPKHAVVMAGPGWFSGTRLPSQAVLDGLAARKTHVWRTDYGDATEVVGDQHILITSDGKKLKVDADQ